MRILSLTASENKEVNLSYIPQFIAFDNIQNIDKITVTALGAGTVIDLNDNDNIKAVLQDDNFGTSGGILMLSDGLIPKENCQISVTSNATGTLKVFAFSLQKGTYVLRTNEVQTLANTSTRFENFHKLIFITNQTATNISMSKGDFSDTISFEELAIASTYGQVSQLKEISGQIADNVIVNSPSTTFTTIEQRINLLQ